ncbi:MAG: hypothetical protein GQ534_04605 [Candidatus Delongbacteria bacterium]|nr:hypothetical protein [Candidatus Delongbacteria bacterium]
MISTIDASAFNYSNEIYETEFKQILAGITECYKMMIKDNIKVPNNENGIRDILYLEYLRKQEIRLKVGLIEYRIDRETQEDHTNGRVDLRIFSKNDFENYDAIYIIECKRLDNTNLTGMSGLNGEYINNGIQRFVSNYYSSYYNVNGMIGFVVQQLDILDNIQKINQLLENNFPNTNTVNYIESIDFIEDFEYSFYSIHRSSNKDIKLYHLMFDFSDNIEEQN